MTPPWPPLSCHHLGTWTGCMLPLILPRHRPSSASLPPPSLPEPSQALAMHERGTSHGDPIKSTRSPEGMSCACTAGRAKPWGWTSRPAWNSDQTNPAKMTVLAQAGLSCIRGWHFPTCFQCQGSVWISGKLRLGPWHADSDLLLMFVICVAPIRAMPGVWICTMFPPHQDIWSPGKWWGKRTAWVYYIVGRAWTTHGIVLNRTCRSVFTPPETWRSSLLGFAFRKSTAQRRSLQAQTGCVNSWLVGQWA